jgi:hypothetical protein
MSGACFLAVDCSPAPITSKQFAGRSARVVESSTSTLARDVVVAMCLLGVRQRAVDVKDHRFLGCRMTTA